MTLHLFFLAFTCILHQGIYANKEYDDNAVKRGDAYIDKLLEDMFQNGAEYDPYAIEDSVIGFNKKVLFVNVSGEAKLHDGFIKGLSTLHRPSHCSLSEDGERLLVTADLGAGQLDFTYAGSVKFMNFGPTIAVHGILSYIEVHIEFTVDPKSGKEGKLEKFIIDDMRGMNVWVTGLGPINWAVNPIISGVTRIFKRFVTNFMENKVEKHVAERIPNFQFPVEDKEPVTNEPEVTNSKQSDKTNQEDRETTSREMLQRTSEPEFETTTKEELEHTREEEHESTLKEKMETTSEPEHETSTKEELEHTREEEHESTLKKMETTREPELETTSSEEHESTLKKMETTREPELETTSSEELEHTREVEHESTLKQKLETESLLGLEPISEEELENTNEPELEKSSAELDQKQPKSRRNSNEQLQKQPVVEDCSTEQLKKDQETLNKGQAVLRESEIESGEEADESDRKGSSDESGTTSSSELSKEAAEALERLDESYQVEELPEDPNEPVLEE